MDALPSADPEPSQQEPWDMGKFVVAYNREADKQGGWHYEENSRTDSLRGDYETEPPVHLTVEEFARTVFLTEQRY